MNEPATSGAKRLNGPRCSAKTNAGKRCRALRRKRRPLRRSQRSDGQCASWAGQAAGPPAADIARMTGINLQDRPADATDNRRVHDVLTFLRVQTREPPNGALHL